MVELLEPIIHKLFVEAQDLARDRYVCADGCGLVDGGAEILEKNVVRRTGCKVGAYHPATMLFEHSALGKSTGKGAAEQVCIQGPLDARTPGPQQPQPKSH